MKRELIQNISNRELYYLANNTGKLYKLVTIPKKNGGTREVYAPKDNLKWCQHYIAENYLGDYPVSKYATAYQKNKSILDNANVHCGKKYILKLDIEDFFGSIGFDKVYSVFYRYYPADVSKLFAEICTFRDFLVQGSPASPVISNIVMYNFDMIIGKWCDERGISYTRYCDDLTFSSDEKLYVVYHKTKSLLLKYGFYLNNKKTHFVSNYHQQNVTGIVVNEKPQVSSSYRRKLRQEIYYCNKYGIESHINKIGLDYTVDEYKMLINGKINYVLSINPNDIEFQKCKGLFK